MRKRFTISKTGEIKKRSVGRCLFPPDSEHKTLQRKLLGKNNEAESHIDQLLKDANLVYIRERPISIQGKLLFIDFLIYRRLENETKLRVALEIDGGYHATKPQQENDNLKNALLLNSAKIYSILRLTAEFALSLSSQNLLDLIQSQEIDTICHIPENKTVRRDESISLLSEENKSKFAFDFPLNRRSRL